MEIIVRGRSPRIKCQRAKLLKAKAFRRVKMGYYCSSKARTKEDEERLAFLRVRRP